MNARKPKESVRPTASNAAVVRKNHVYQRLVSGQDYLNTSYEPDCEYLDGELLKRSVGTKDHSNLSLFIAA